MTLLHATDALDVAEADLEGAQRVCDAMDGRTSPEGAVTALERMGAAQRSVEAARWAFEAAQDAECPEADA